MIRLYYKNFLLGALILAAVAGIIISSAQAEIVDLGSEVSPDAIAVRITPNPNHYSIIHWYYSQGFVGSPQSLVVDGYEAIRDGRTVYVNAANVDMVNKNIYTNIYLISYTQDQTDPTIDILGQLVSRWKFNSNLVESGTPTCSFSSVVCKSDADCGSGQSCSVRGLTAGSCVLSAPKNCLVDADCPAKFFCDSLKSKITRDIQRLGKLNEVQEALSDFNWSNNSYPLLAAGTYLPGHSISVWPSWSEELLSEIAVAPGLRDPVNRLGPCVPEGGAGVAEGFDPVTCWNSQTRKFINEPGDATLTLPAGSYAFVYSTNEVGSKYNLCASLESRESHGVEFNFAPAGPDDSACVSVVGVGQGGVSINTSPRLVDKMMTGQPNQEFNGYIQVIDTEQEILSWSWESQVGRPGWEGWRSNGQNNQPPRLLDTSNPKQKKIYSEKAGQPGTYNLVIKVSDGVGGTLTTSTPITIASNPIVLEAADIAYEPSTSERLRYRLAFSGSAFSNPTANTPVVTKISGPYDLLGVLANPEKNITLEGGKYQVEHSGIIPSSYKFLQDTTFRYNVSVTDSYNQTAQKQFAITIKSVPPALNFSCSGSNRAGQFYSCLLGANQQSGRPVNYLYTTGYPARLEIEKKSSGTYLEGNSLMNTIGSYDIVVKAVGEYGASSTKAFNLKVNSYCGDGLRQLPNTEGRGGIYNNGAEDCDGNDYVTNQATLSSISRQYGCSTKVAMPSPYPILNNNQCVFLSPSTGGGFCGDSFCQTIYEDISTCPGDCLNPIVCLPNCNEAICGNDGCGGSCGQCSGVQVCGNNRQCMTPACFEDADCEDSNPCTVDSCENPGLREAACANIIDDDYFEACDDEHTFGSCLSGQTTTCSTGTCTVSSLKYCKSGVLGNCQSAVDPRVADCKNKCEGESNGSVYGSRPGLCKSGTPGSCINTGNGSACDYMGQTLTCNKLLGSVDNTTAWNDRSASCESNCRGYDTSLCEPSFTSGYWWQPTSIAPYPMLLPDGYKCIVKMNVNSNHEAQCNNVSLQAGAQWFIGSMKVAHYEGRLIDFCAVDGCQTWQRLNACGERYPFTYTGSWYGNCLIKKP